MWVVVKAGSGGGGAMLYRSFFTNQLCLVVVRSINRSASGLLSSEG